MTKKQERELAFKQAALKSAPKSLNALEHDWPEFSALARTRMVRGIPVYGDATFKKSLDAILVDIEEELLDWANYSFMAWCRVRETRNLIRAKVGEMKKVSTCQSADMIAFTAARKARPRKPSTR